MLIHAATRNCSHWKDAFVKLQCGCDRTTGWLWASACATEGRPGRCWRSAHQEERLPIITQLSVEELLNRLFQVPCDASMHVSKSSLQGDGMS